MSFKVSQEITISFCECLCESVNWMEARVKSQGSVALAGLRFQLCFLSASHRLASFIASYIIEDDSKDVGETA